MQKKPDEWIDFYHVLQVHQFAEPDVIENTYKKLCKKYHPDVNHDPGAEERMKLINRAYEVLGDEKKRDAYFKMWSEKTQKTLVPMATQLRAQVTESMLARRVIIQYFICLSTRLYEDAYHLLSQADRQYVSFASFTEWQKSVAEVYRIVRFDARASKHYDEFMLDDKRVCTAECFTIDITEENLSTRSTSRYSFKKFVIREENGWRVYLGYRDINYVINQFKHAANTREEAEVLSQWNEYKSSMDFKLGLPNRKGFLSKAMTEVYRNKRYQRKLTMCALQCKIQRDKLDQDFTYRLKVHVAQTLKRMLRALDMIAIVGDFEFAVLFPETDAASALIVCNRLVERINRDVWACFDTGMHIRFNVRAYTGGDIAQTLDACLAQLQS